MDEYLIIAAQFWDDFGNAALGLLAFLIVATLFWRRRRSATEQKLKDADRRENEARYRNR
jgi:hypothetical protein